MKIEIRARPVFDLPLTAEDVQLLCDLAEAHYDSRCKSAGRVGGFLYGWKNMMTLRDTGGGEVAPSGACSVDATWNDIDTTLKILEMAGPYLRGNKDEAGIARANAITTALRTAGMVWNQVSPSWVYLLDTDVPMASDRPAAFDDRDVLQAIRMTNPDGWSIQLKGGPVQSFYGPGMPMAAAVTLARLGINLEHPFDHHDSIAARMHGGKNRNG